VPGLLLAAAGCALLLAPPSTRALTASRAGAAAR